MTFIVFDMSPESNVKFKYLNLYQLDGMSGLGIFLFSNNVLLAGRTVTAPVGMPLGKWVFLPRPFSASKINLKDSNAAKSKKTLILFKCHKLLLFLQKTMPKCIFCSGC